MDRRSFLRRSTIAVAGGLLVGDAALDAFERLTHRKVFALGGLPHRWQGREVYFDAVKNAAPLVPVQLNVRYSLRTVQGPMLYSRELYDDLQAIERFGSPKRLM